MDMGEAMTCWNQYGFATDVFDKYREAVRKSNSGAVKVLSIAAIADAVLMTVFGVLHQPGMPFADDLKASMPLSGLWLCIFLLLAGVAGVIVSFRENSSRTGLLVTGYLISVGFYGLAIFGTVTMNTDAFWIGTQVAVGCFLLDYAWRVGVLQLASYVALHLAWNASGITANSTRLLFSTLFLVVGLVTFYTMNHTRVTLIMGREESRRQADTDLLTGLTIRIAAQQEIEEHLKTDDHGVMMLLDLDRFKSVNDRLGHQMGDKVLVDVAADLKKMFRNSDVLSRLGGDEFVVYLNSVPEKDWALQRASQVVREVRRWVGNGTTNIQVTASVGIVMTDMVARNYDDLYRAADIAMYNAKHEGGNKALFYSADMLDNRETVEGPVRIEAPGRNGETGSAAR
ncbi:MAG: GGDEF domain-containing protein [Clostridiales bacterium]|nr:GGDEF domain-containing protein [Clostridiales bacterium]